MQALPHGSQVVLCRLPSGGLQLRNTLTEERVSVQDDVELEFNEDGWGYLSQPGQSPVWVKSRLSLAAASDPAVKGEPVWVVDTATKDRTTRSSMEKQSKVMSMSAVVRVSNGLEAHGPMIAPGAQHISRLALLVGFAASAAKCWQTVVSRYKPNCR